MPAVTDTPAEGGKTKKSKMPLLIGLILACAGGGGGYFAVQSGIIGGAAEKPAEGAASPAGGKPATEAFAFVPLEPMVISLKGPQQYLRFTAQIEVDPAHVAEVTAIVPRIVDILNGFLRAVEPSDLADPIAMMRLRTQILHRVGIVAGPGIIRDVLIMEFVLN